MSEEQVLEIARLGAQGDGIAGAAGEEVFVPFALPGERWQRDGGDGYALLAEHPQRAAAKCPHYMACGGCLAQHMPDELYRAWKRGIVVEAFRHRGLEPEVRNLKVVAPRSRRRAVFAVERRGADVAVGFREAGSHDLVDVLDCAVLAPAVLAARRPLTELARALVPADGSLRAAVLETSNGLAIDLTVPRHKASVATRSAIAETAERHRLAEVSINRDVAIRRSPPDVEFSGVAVTVPPAAFVQAVAEAERLMASLAVEGVGKARHVADLFAGLGTFSFAVAPRARVLAVESERSLLEALTGAARRAQGLKPVETRLRDLYREPLSRKELEPFEAVVMDPPRAGALAQSEMLARSKVPVVVMISCNPATLARDCRVLVDGGYQLGPVSPIDQFLWSPHTEAVVVARRP